VDVLRTRDAFLAAPLRELLAYWLELRCDVSLCTKVVCTPVRLLAAKRGGQLRLQIVLARLRCSHCGEPPVHAVLTDSPIDVAPHETVDGARWRIALVPSETVARGSTSREVVDDWRLAASCS
jgi:hypothetical protein